VRPALFLDVAPMYQRSTAASDWEVMVMVLVGHADAVAADRWEVAAAMTM